MISHSNQKLILKMVDMVQYQKTCEHFSTICSSQICKFHSCQSYSGGALVLSQDGQALLGVISFGTAYGVEKYSVGVNTRVTSYLPWIYNYNICPVNAN